jgi:pimeloyl-ACP methyl ester carboxylesterase
MRRAERAPPRGAGEWERLEELLVGSSVRVRRGAPPAAALEGFDAAELGVLRRLAMRSRLSRSREPRRGNVILLPDHMGSELASVSRRGEDPVWISAPAIARGGFSRLALAPDGPTEARPRARVVARRPLGHWYARAMLALRARWNVDTYAYDWRRGLDDAADGLAAIIRERHAGQPVHLVAHGAGGLVARQLVLRHPQLWGAMQDPAGAAGGRLVMLGTPNFGSYAAVHALAGADRVTELLAACDSRHDTQAVLVVAGTFAGSYQLLPAPSRLPGSLSSLYQADTWPRQAAVSQALLDRAWTFHEALARGPSVNPERMICVAGCARPTLAGLAIAGRGEFEYLLSLEGDGRVPHALGLLPGVPAWYVEESHGELVRNEDVLRALDDLLETAATALLPARPPATPARAAPTLRDYRRATGDTLPGAALGGARVADGEAAAPPRPPASAHAVPLRLRLEAGDVTEVRAPAVVVGHYRGVEPVNAIGALDARLGGWISLAVKRGMVGGHLGEVFLVPARGCIGAEAVVIAGMGTPGAFNEDALRVLMTNVAMGTAALGMTGFATVLVGAGEGNLDPETALRALLGGVSNAIASLRDAPAGNARLRELVIVEHDPGRLALLADCLRRCAGEDGLGLRLKLRLPTAAQLARARRAHRQPLPAREGASRRRADEVWLTLESPPGGTGRFRCSAIARGAVVPVREVEVDAGRFRALSQALQDAESPADQAQYGRLLYEYLMPEDFDPSLEAAGSLRFIVDSTTASFPWEMACLRPRGGGGTVQRLGIDKRLTRQFRTMLTRPPGTTPAAGDGLRVLVIADPAPEPELRLRHARREGRRVAEALRALGRPGRPLHVETCIGPGECSPVEILKLLLTGDFDVVHYAGHGEYDPADPGAAGWVLGLDEVLTARDVFRARRVPRLVFANACFSGAIHATPAFDRAELARGTATLAQAFFERGVPNFVGTGWPVEDEQAVTFAVTFYERLVHGATMREAVQAARRGLFDAGTGSTWGAFQHYGDPDDVLLRPATPVSRYRG